MFKEVSFMKKLLLATVLLFGSAHQILATGGWTPVSQAQAERDLIMNKIKQIRAYYQTAKFHLSGIGAARSSTYQSQDGLCQADIFNLLKNIGSSTSYQILKDMCASGELPQCFLNRA